MTDEDMTLSLQFEPHGLITKELAIQLEFLQTALQFTHKMLLSLHVKALHVFPLHTAWIVLPYCKPFIKDEIIATSEQVDSKTNADPDFTSSYRKNEFI